jgi:hypothetical protein
MINALQALQNQDAKGMTKVMRLLNIYFPWSSSSMGFIRSFTTKICIKGNKNIEQIIVVMSQNI